jgi:hypothetical protein
MTGLLIETTCSLRPGWPSKWHGLRVEAGFYYNHWVTYNVACATLKPFYPTLERKALWDFNVERECHLRPDKRFLSPPASFFWNDSQCESALFSQCLISGAVLWDLYKHQLSDLISQAHPTNKQHTTWVVLGSP